MNFGYFLIKFSGVPTGKKQSQTTTNLIDYLNARITYKRNIYYSLQNTGLVCREGENATF